MKRGRFVVLSPASLSIELANRQLERVMTHSWGMAWVLSQVVPRLGKHFLFLSKHLIFSLLIKLLGQRDKGQ